MATDRNLNFRLRGIPRVYQSREDVRKLVNHVLSIEQGASVNVHSLAKSPVDLNSNVATLTFDTLPSWFSGSTSKEWTVILRPGEIQEEAAFGPNKFLVFDTHFLDFTPLQNDEDVTPLQNDQDGYDLDVIVIPGLGGHALGSFKAENSAFVWLRDALPQDLPRARILVYGYDTRIKLGLSRNIVLIGHSMGGLVIKEVIVQLSEEMNEKYTQILTSITGILFFGVPHQGMTTGPLVSLVGDNINRGLLESVNKDSALLKRLEKDFHAAWSKRKPEIISFFETEASPTPEMRDGKWMRCGRAEVLVTRESAISGSREHYPINCNHSRMVKYTSLVDVFYGRVRHVLQKLPIIQSHRLTGNNLTEHSKFLSSLSFGEQKSRYDSLHPTTGTCGWLAQDSQFQAWRNKSRGLLWIKGPPGTGKSVLMKFAVTMMSDRVDKELIVSYFIHGRGTPLQKSPEGVFRALLHSMLGHFPKHLSQFAKRFKEKERRSASQGECNLSLRELQGFMSEVLTKGTRNQPTIIFVDALDECGHENAREMVEYFQDLMEDVERESGQVKICFSSRQYPVIKSEPIPTISVKDKNDSDIQIVVQKRLRQIYPEEDRKEIEKDILLKAQGGFQWAVIVSDKAVEGNANGTKVEKLRECLTTTPETLNELYADLLGDISAEEKSQTTKLFQWLLFAQRPLAAQELRDALATDQDMACTTISLLQSHVSWIKDLDNFMTYVKRISRGLVEFHTRDFWEKHERDGEDWDKEAQFVHQSVADYVLDKYLGYNNGNPSDSQTKIQAGHLQISRSCLQYLSLREMLEGARLSSDTLPTRYPLIPYIVQFLFHHIQKVEDTGFNQTDLLNLIHWDDQSKFLRPTANVWKIMDPGNIRAPVGWPFIGATPLHVLVAFGSKSACDALLQQEEIKFDGTDVRGNTPLLLAIREGHQDIALLLLNRSIRSQHHHSGENLESIDEEEPGLGTSCCVEVDAENEDGETPLTLALTKNAGDVVFRLLEAGAKL
ncbi:hypothetical protein GQ53DRAFT_687160, partial [Thozetella sp. PMI_491]